MMEDILWALLYQSHVFWDSSSLSLVQGICQISEMQTQQTPKCNQSKLFLYNLLTEYIKNILTVVLCPALHLPHGEITYTKSSVNGKHPVATAASFTCSHFYRREGHSSIICKTSGNWDHQTPSCSLSNENKYFYTKYPITGSSILCIFDLTI